MSAGTQLAWVVPITPMGWAMIRADGTRDGYEAVSREVAESWRSKYDEEHPERAPHTVQQLARVVRVVAVDDAMVERLRHAARIEDDTTVVDRTDLLALLAALTPPEPTGTEGA